MAITENGKPNSALALHSLEIKGYRAFNDLSIPRVAQVNLITGKNSVGKSSILEAVHLFVRRASPDAVGEVLFEREGELTDSTDQSRMELHRAVIRMFHGASPYLDWAYDGDRLWGMTVGGAVNGSNQNQLVTLGTARPRPETEIPLGLHTSVIDTSADSEDNSFTYAIGRIVSADRHMWERPGTAPSVFLGPRGLDRSRVGQLWDKIALSPSQGDVTKALRLINAQIEEVGVFGDEVGVGLGRVPHARVEGDFTRHPLSEFGDGMNRLFGILVALGNAHGGVLLVDEVETGLHYSVLTEVWKSIFELSHRLSVQVFATTHSWECIEAFQAAASVSAASGALIRLQHRRGDIATTIFDERRLGIATRDQIEVR